MPNQFPPLPWREVYRKRPLSEAPRGRLVRLVWHDGIWRWCFGQWREGEGWIADPVTEGNVRLPCEPTHWVE